MPAKDWWKLRGWRALWSLLACFVLCLLVLGADFGAALALDSYTDRLPSGHFIFRVFFLCVGVVTVCGLFAPAFAWEKKKAAYRLKSVLTDADGLAWLVLTALTVLLLPEGLGFLPNANLQVYADSLPLRLGLAAFSLVTGVLVMVLGGGMEPSEKRVHPTVFGALMIAKGAGLALLFALAALVVPAVFTAFCNLASVGSFLSLSLIAVLVALFLLLGFAGALLAYFRKKSFFQRLRKLCGKQGIVIQEERCSFSRLFFSKNVCSAVLSWGERTIVMRLCGLRHRYTPAVFEQEGKGARLHTLQFAGVKLLSWRTPFSFAVEGEGEKVAVLCPCPKSIYVTKVNGTLVEADNGDQPLDRSCTLYTAEGFFNYLDRLSRDGQRG